MTASITDITRYLHRHKNPLVVATDKQGESHLSQLINCAEANLKDLLLHCAMEGLSPKNIEELVAPPLRLPIDYCIPDVVSLLDSAMHPVVPLSRPLWHKAVPKALFSRFEPETEDDSYFLLALLEDAYRDLSRALNAKR